MKKLTLISVVLICFLASNNLHAQQTCNCIANLDTTIKKTELNYAGYPDMIERKLLPKYKRMVTQLRTAAEKQTDPQKCFSILNTYVGFFQDKHFDIEYSVTDTTRYIYKHINEQDFKNNYSARKRDDTEGIWVNPDTTLKLAIEKIGPLKYQAIVLESKNAKLKPGLVYYTFTKSKNGFIFDRYDWMTPDFPVRQYGGLLFVWNFEVWGRVFPSSMTDYEKTEFLTWRNYNYGLDCKKLDQDNVLLSIGSFNRDDKIRQIIQKNDSLIRSAKHLIVDLRGNGGGNSGWSYLMPYFYTQPIVQGDTYLRLTQENIKANLPSIKSMYEKPSQDPMWIKSNPPELLAKYKKAFDEIQVSKEQFYKMPSSTLFADSSSANPKQIALIFDDLGGSSTEYFFYISLQSSKIKRYGTRTLGMMDYMGVSQQTTLPFADYYLLIPDRKAAWTDTDRKNITGFVPENDLSHLPRHKWIDYIKANL